MKHFNIVTFRKIRYVSSSLIRIKKISQLPALKSRMFRLFQVNESGGELPVTRYPSRSLRFPGNSRSLAVRFSPRFAKISCLRECVRKSVLKLPNRPTRGRFSLFKLLATASSSQKWKSRPFHFLTIYLRSIIAHSPS